MLNDAYSSGLVCDLFTKGSHHRNIKIILITQHTFHQSKHCRDISLNAKYLVFLKNVRDRSQFSPFAQQVYPKQCWSVRFVSTRHCKSARVPCTGSVTGQNDLLRFRTESSFPLICAPVDYETDTIDLSTLIVLKTADPNLRKAVIANCNQETMKNICECDLNVLRGNIQLSASSKRKLRPYKNSSQVKRKVLSYRGGFLLLLLSAILPTLAGLLFRSN